MRVEDFLFERQRLVGGLGDASASRLAEFVGGEAHRAGHGLAMDEVALSGALISLSPCCAETSTK